SSGENEGHSPKSRSAEPCTNTTTNNTTSAYRNYDCDYSSRKAIETEFACSKSYLAITLSRTHDSIAADEYKKAKSSSPYHRSYPLAVFRFQIVPDSCRRPA